MNTLRIVSLALLAALSACGGLNPSNHADSLAASAHMRRQIVSTDKFKLTTFSRITRPGEPLMVYIEGDGLAWLSSGEASPNPTPHKALGLALAAADPAPNVLYIARPCQFTPLTLDDNCSTDTYWTDKRFAPEVVTATSQVIDHFVGFYTIHLVGYSGGGAIAALVASSRSDVASLRTVAGNLDTEAFNTYHNVSAMPQSLNPIAIAPRLANLPQEHFVGDKDEMVTPQLSENFNRAIGATRCVTITHVGDADHESHWLDFWKSAVKKLPSCH